MKKLIRTAAQVILALLIIPFVLEKPVHSLLESSGMTGEYSYEILLGITAVVIFLIMDRRRIRARREGYRNLYVPGAVCMRQENTVPSRFREQLEIGNLEYFRYKNRSIGQLAGRPYLAVIQRLRSRKAERAGLGETREAALQRGRMMCFQAEMELMERTELGMSVTKQTLCEEFCMEVKDENLKRVYPLYLGERPDH